jgi:hypothetical protein
MRLDGIEIVAMARRAKPSADASLVIAPGDCRLCGFIPETRIRSLRRNLYAAAVIAAAMAEREASPPLAA